MSTSPFMLDLCCGFGGASRAAKDRGWRVVTLDISPRVKPDIVGTLEALPLRCSPDLLWISPCCKTFTLWRLPWQGRPKPDVSMMRAALEAVKYLKPRFWVIENVPAAAEWCKPFLGTPQLKTHAHVFWSNMFLLLPRVKPHKENIPGHCWDTHWRRSLMPYEISLAFVKAAEEHGARAGVALSELERKASSM